MTSAQTVPAPKLDESLREAVARGCIGTQSVIIRTQPGCREGLTAALTAHGDAVIGEFAALDAVAAVVHCDDLKTLASFSSTNSVSFNAPVGGLTQLSDTKADVVKATAELRAAQAAVRRALGRGSSKAEIIAARARATEAVAALAAARQKQTSVQGRDQQGGAAHGLQAQFLKSFGVSGVSKKNKKSKLVTSSSASLGTIVTSTSSSSTTLGATLGLTTGTGDGSIGVAVIDSGIEDGLDLDSRITAFYDFTHGDILAATPSDGYGHGTHVAGLVASAYVGVNPDARLIGLRVLNDQGQSSTADVLRAIEFAITNKNLLNIQVLNLSLGHPIYEPAATDPLVQAVEHTVREGQVVVVSAGNFGINPNTGQPGYAGIASPGNSPSAISVGTVRTFNTVTCDDDRIALYSSRGPSWYDGFAKPDFSAPGDNLLSVAAAGSVLRQEQEKRGNTGEYMRLSGTSMAAGVASGVVSLVLESNHGLTPNALKAVLEYSAIPVKDDDGVGYDALTQGSGGLNAAGALALAGAISPAAPVGSSWLTSAIAPSTVIGATVYAWGQHVIWGEGLDDTDNIV